MAAAPRVVATGVFASSVLSHVLAGAARLMFRRAVRAGALTRVLCSRASVCSHGAFSCLGGNREVDSIHLIRFVESMIMSPIGSGSSQLHLRPMPFGLKPVLGDRAVPSPTNFFFSVFFSVAL